MKRVVLALVLLAAAARADEPAPTFGNPFRFTEVSGAAIYQSVCAGCHMADGRGAVGAAAYPRLAGDVLLASADYAATRVLLGSGAMPPFARSLSDEQIAAVVDYIRTHFGNSTPGAPVASEIASLRLSLAGQQRP